MVPFAIAGIATWTVLGLVLLAVRPALVEQGREHWLTICLAGALLGLPGLAIMLVHDRNRRRRRSESTRSER
ncbi:MAG TPA: DUF2530 domain-containing protein [Micromonosporaceae bacterium]|nr:DUF2530 domain-containing protein [Micromonosporaceae bacterium]